MRTSIQHGTTVAWNGERHVVLDNAELVFDGNEIAYIGKRYDGVCEKTIDATGRLVIPGFVNAHLHVTDTPFTRGWLEDISVPKGFGAPKPADPILYRILPTIRHAIDAEAQAAAAEAAFAELARTGSTTVVELPFDYEVMDGGKIELSETIAEIGARSGLRCYVGPRFRSGYYGEGRDGKVHYRKYKNSGWERFADCVAFCRKWNGLFDDRLRTMLAPGQVDTCEPELLRETRRAADELGVPIQLHAGQSPNEYRRIRESQGRTTVEFLGEVGLLGPDFLIGHGTYLAEDGDVNTMAKHEIAAIVESQTSIVHLPWVWARSGIAINSIQKYMDAGIRLAIGTDTFPFDMFNDMRFAATFCKLIEQSEATGTSEDVFRMATVGGADALGRPDLGRLAVGCKADIVLVRVDTPKASPIYDPFKFLVLAASGEDVDTVIVDGRTIVKGGEVLTIDVPTAVARLNEAGKRVRERYETLDPTIQDAPGEAR